MLTFLLKLLLCLILVNVINCSLGFILDDLRRTSELECIYNSGYEYSVYYALSSSQGINENSTDALNNVKNAKLKAEVVYVPCRGRSPQL